METIYLIGKVITKTNNKTACELKGIYASKALAKKACVTMDEFIFPISLNERLNLDSHYKDLCYPVYERKVVK